MINVVNKTIENTIYCPKNLTETEVNFVFDIHSEITNKSFVFEVIDQSSGSSYYKFNVLFDEVPDGEYNWYVLLSGETRSEGLIRIGNWNPASNGTAYHLIQYDAAGYSPIDLQTKQVEINSEGFTTVEPDNGFVGLKEVQVFVDVPNEYEEGFEDGEAAQKAKLIALEVKANGRYEREDGYNQVDVDIDTTPYYESGYTAGYDAGYESGSTEGSEEGYESGYTAGVEAGEAQQKAKLITTAITENGTYAREDGYSSVSVDVPTTVNNQNKTVEYTENGTYIVVPAAGYSGLGSVTINTNVPHTGHTDAEMEQAYQSGYTSGETVGYESGYTSGETVGYASGKTDGVAEQKAKLVETAITVNGVYEKEDGYKKVTVNVPQTGSTINNQNKTVPITTNGTTAVTFDAGYTGLGTVTINTNVPTGHTDAELEAAYASGVTDGEVTQKAKLITTAVTTNGTYSRADGYSSVTVNVPTGGTINNQDKTVTYPTNGTYTVTADAGYTGLGTVTVNVDTSGSTPESRVSITLTNQLLVGVAGFNFTYDGGSTAYTFTASTITIDGLLPGKPIIISFNYVEGYNSPLAISTYTVYGETVMREVTYERNLDPSQPFTVTALATTVLNFINTVEYSINSGTTQTLLGRTDITLYEGDSMRVWCSFGGWDSSSSSGSCFSTGGTMTVSGNIMSLFYGTDFEDKTDYPESGSVLLHLFKNSTSLVNASGLILPVTNLSRNRLAYRGMFYSCSNMQYGPQLPATILGEGCYSNMFEGCSSLIAAPVLPVTNLPSTSSLGVYESMFRNCSALKHAPELPATTLTEGCYRNMFEGCTSLEYIKCLATDISADNCIRYWMHNVASSGTFVKNLNMSSWPVGTAGNKYAGTPPHWTIVDNA